MSIKPQRIVTKSRYTRGLQCEKLLWLSLNEPEAEKLEVDIATQARFDTGNKVGALARTYVPGGTLIDRPEDDFMAPVTATTDAIEQGAKILYEAVFFVDRIYCAIDILEKAGRGWSLVEVKSSTKVKPEHLPDVAIQVYAARKAGLDIRKAEIMVLNRECRFPDLSNLFVRHDVTAEVEELVSEVETNVARFLKVVNATKEPRCRTGAHCYKPYECPFLARCHGARPEHHVSSLYYTNPSTAEKLEKKGYDLVSDLDAQVKLNAIQLRQVEAVKRKRTVVEGGLKAALDELEGPLTFLDFETVAPAIPVWEGCRPYDSVPAQFSAHVEHGRKHKHFEWIATAAGDPRRAFAEALIEACKGSQTIVAYNAAFERKHIKSLASHLPDLADDLNSTSDRVVDLLPIVRDHVYHPKFYGSFSIKTVLPALCPDLSYQDLDVGDGDTASRLLEIILTDPDKLRGRELARIVESLTEYCKLDTWAMVRLLERLRELADKE